MKFYSSLHATYPVLKRNALTAQNCGQAELKICTSDGQKAKLPYGARHCTCKKSGQTIPSAQQPYQTGCWLVDWSILNKCVSVRSLTINSLFAYFKFELFIHSLMQPKATFESKRCACWCFEELYNVTCPMLNATTVRDWIRVRVCPI